MNITCNVCKESLPSDSFYKDTRKKNGFSSSCKSCSSKRAVEWQKKTDYNKTRKRTKRPYESVRKDHLMRAYGITVEEYTAQYEKQDGKCGICDTELELLYVDHCHSSLRNRGLLCKECNLGLGFFKDNVEALKKAQMYLESFGIWEN